MDDTGRWRDVRCDGPGRLPTVRSCDQLLMRISDLLGLAEIRCYRCKRYHTIRLPAVVAVTS